MSDVVVVLVSVPSAEKGAEIARLLVEEKLAACANLLPAMRSIYRWRDAVQDEQESLLLIKTTGAGFDALRARVVELHPYEVPEVLALPVEAGHLPYLDWLRSSVE